MISGDDDVMILDARASIAAALSRAVIGYSDNRVRALAWLAVATPSLYGRLVTLLREVGINQSPGAARTLVDALKALSLEDYHNRQLEKRKAE